MSSPRCCGLSGGEVTADSAEDADKAENEAVRVRLFIRVIRGSFFGSVDRSVEAGGGGGILADWDVSAPCTAGF